MRVIWMGAAALAMLASGAQAGTRTDNGAARIMAGDLAAAEQDIVARQRLDPQAVDLMLNLAAIYAATGREAKAKAVYARVAALEDEDVVLGNGRMVGSRDLAVHAMARMPVALASR